MMAVNGLGSWEVLMERLTMKQAKRLHRQSDCGGMPFREWVRRNTPCGATFEVGKLRSIADDRIELRPEWSPRHPVTG